MDQANVRPVKVDLELPPFLLERLRKAAQARGLRPGPFVVQLLGKFAEVPGPARVVPMLSAQDERFSFQMPRELHGTLMGLRAQWEKATLAGLVRLGIEEGLQALGEL